MNNRPKRISRGWQILAATVICGGVWTVADPAKPLESFAKGGCLGLIGGSVACILSAYRPVLVKDEEEYDDEYDGTPVGEPVGMVKFSDPPPPKHIYPNAQLQLPAQPQIVIPEKIVLEHRHSGDVDLLNGLRDIASSYRQNSTPVHAEYNQAEVYGEQSNEEYEPLIPSTPVAPPLPEVNGNSPLVPDVKTPPKPKPQSQERRQEVGLRPQVQSRVYTYQGEEEGESDTLLIPEIPAPKSSNSALEPDLRKKDEW